jgi:hypothetical protein
MLFVQQKVKYHPPKELNTSKQKNKCRTNNKNKPPNKQTNPEKTPPKNTLNKFMGFVSNGPRYFNAMQILSTRSINRH